MSLKPLKITFQMDGTGVVMYPQNPVHLDSLLAWALYPGHLIDRGLERNEVPEIQRLPLGEWHIGGHWGWHASALFPDRDIESLQYWRKKFRTNRIHMTKGSPNLMSGKYKEYNMPMPLILCNTMTAYALGSRKRVSQLLKRIKYIGKKGAYGKGAIVGVEVEIIEQDFSLAKDRKAMRFLPKKDGNRYGRIRPPYWNATERIQTYYVGENYK
jgi:CRISPR type IV-associated protein Csf3